MQIHVHALNCGAGNSGWDSTWSGCNWLEPGTGGGDPTPPAGNLAAGRPVTASSSVQNYVPRNTVDGNANSYWESASNSWPQSLTVDLGNSLAVKRLVLKLPPSSAWVLDPGTRRRSRCRGRTLAMCG